MPWWLITLLLYLTMALLCVRPVAGALAWRWHRNDIAKWSHLRNRSEPTGDQWFGGILSGLAVGAIWPLALLFVLQGRHDRWVIGAERLARLEASEARVRELESQLGIEERKS